MSLLQVVELVLGGPLDGELHYVKVSQVRLVVLFGDGCFAEYTRVSDDAFAFVGHAVDEIIYTEED